MDVSPGDQVVVDVDSHLLTRLESREGRTLCVGGLPPDPFALCCLRDWKFTFEIERKGILLQRRWQHLCQVKSFGLLVGRLVGFACRLFCWTCNSSTWSLLGLLF